MNKHKKFKKLFLKNYFSCNKRNYFIYSCQIVCVKTRRPLSLILLEVFNKQKQKQKQIAEIFVYVM
jgi:hypothetical protein